MADEIKEEYKALTCYTKMDEPHRRSFDALARYYGRILNRGPAQTVTVYTSHDFDRHCFNLYRIISMYLLREEGIQQLNPEELYLLNLSVLLHDISMCEGGYENGKKTAFNRAIHAIQSAEWIQHEFDQGDKPLSEYGLTAEQVEIICDICRAHSSVEDWKETTGLFAPELSYKKDGHTGKIRVKALAGIVRIADELDVARNRLKRADEMDRLLTAADDDRAEVQMFIRENENSRKHFRRLLLIRSLERCEENTTQIALKLDMGQVEKRRMAGDAENLVDDLDAIKRKIQGELDTLWTEVISKEAAGAGRLIMVQRVVWTEEDERYIKSLGPAEAPDAPVDIHPVQKETPQALDATEGAVGEMPPAEGVGTDVELLDVGLSQKIGKCVKERQLLHVGHYRLNTTYCARDWIDTERLIEDPQLAADIYGMFSDHIWTVHRTEKFTIVGLDLLGAKVAAQVGVNLHKPFTYVIPAHQYAEADSHEVDIPAIPEEHKVVLVTDSIITGLTATDVIQKNRWEGRVLAVYTVFYRRPKTERGNERTHIPCTIRALNTDFPAEIVSASRCPYGDISLCQAGNQKLK